MINDRLLAMVLRGKYVKNEETILAIIIFKSQEFKIY